jgi:hypothetical protein
MYPHVAVKKVNGTWGDTIVILPVNRRVLLK